MKKHHNVSYFTNRTTTWASSKKLDGQHQVSRG